MEPAAARRSHQQPAMVLHGMSYPKRIGHLLCLEHVPLDHGYKGQKASQSEPSF